MKDLTERSPEEPLAETEREECRKIGDQFVALGERLRTATTVADIIAVDKMVDALDFP